MPPLLLSSEFDPFQVAIIVIAVLVGFVKWLWENWQMKQGIAPPPPPDPEEQRLRDEVGSFDESADLIESMRRRLGTTGGGAQREDHPTEMPRIDQDPFF